MNTIQSLWRSYHDKVLPDGVSEVQTVECRRAFYAGAQAMFGLMTGPVTGASENAAVRMMDGFREELADFVDRVSRGSA